MKNKLQYLIELRCVIVLHKIWIFIHKKTPDVGHCFKRGDVFRLRNVGNPQNVVFVSCYITFSKNQKIVYHLIHFLQCISQLWKLRELPRHFRKSLIYAWFTCDTYGPPCFKVTARNRLHLLVFVSFLGELVYVVNPHLKLKNCSSYTDLCCSRFPELNWLQEDSFKHKLHYDIYNQTNGLFIPLY